MSFNDKGEHFMVVIHRHRKELSELYRLNEDAYFAYIEDAPRRHLESLDLSQYKIGK